MRVKTDTPTLSSNLAICAWIPLFALRCEEQRRDDSPPSHTPTAVLSPDDNRRLWQVSQIARHFGARSGMTVSQAIGMCPKLILFEPEQALVTQFGKSGRQALQLAAGRIIEPVRGKKILDPIVECVDFLSPIADHGLLTNALSRLLDRALRHPRRIGRRVQAVRVLADLEQKSSWMLNVTLKNPTADRDAILDPIKTRIRQTPPAGAIENLTLEFTRFARGTNELQLFARDATSSARAGQRRALHWAAHEIKTRLKRSLLHHIIEVTPWSRIPERRYALIDYDP